MVIDLSTVSPGTSLAEHAADADRGVRFLDAPVFGSRGEAAAGGLWVVVGGDEATYQAALDVLEPISATRHHMGAAGNGARMKLVGNLLVASQLEALAEAMSLARSNEPCKPGTATRTPRRSSRSSAATRMSASPTDQLATLRFETTLECRRGQPERVLLDHDAAAARR